MAVGTHCHITLFVLACYFPSHTFYPGMDSSFLSSFSGVLVAVAVVGLVTWLVTKTFKQRLPFPPGPKPLPVIGNLLDIPHGKEWLVYQQWAHKYGKQRFRKNHWVLSWTGRLSGDVMHVEAFGQHIIILNSAETAIELFERRSSTYSDRPEAVMANNL